MVFAVFIGKCQEKFIYADGPADKDGIKNGDLIVSINGEPAGATEQNASRLQGKANTSVLLKIKRDNQDLIVPVIRENP
ncbi:MAG: PDZ domain-containing protein [Deltaproteobacteria bacterium]|nr:PDZ domain-containing protein [Deltaproteobacteria bacterium]